MAQSNFLVGDIEGNAEKVIQQAWVAKNTLQADLIIFPELSLTGYPAEDLYCRDGMYKRLDIGLKKIIQACNGVDLLLGYPEKIQTDRFNSVSLISGGKICNTYQKRLLPNYGVFDEVRYFKPGLGPVVIDYHGLRIGLLICEDLWHEGPIQQTVAAGAELIISINASPFDMYKDETRTSMLQKRITEVNLPIFYVNCVGGQDELVFDGSSLVLNSQGSIKARGAFCEESLIPVEFYLDLTTKKIVFKPQPIPALPRQEARIYQALTLGVRDYIEKNHFSSAVLGLSGGIDSALTLAIAVDAIGANRVEAILMPSRYTQAISIEDAKKQAQMLNVKTTQISIEKLFTTALESLATEFENYPTDITEENLQARCRGMLLMAISNKKGSIVLSTGNKSELSVGYSTLYGDMVGGFCVLKDIFKTLVYHLANYRNSLSPIIPKRVIEREPTAELAPNQKDQDFLPPYPLLDEILELYIEQDKSYETIVKLGYEEMMTKMVIRMVNKNEYKRRQAPPGVRITRRAFGRDRRYPITSGYSDYL